MAQSKSTLLWGGRFTGGMDEVMVAFNESLSVDKILYQVDVDASIAYAKALRKRDLLSVHELSEITQGLEAVATEWREGAFVIKPSVDEDIHTANERRLGELVGAQIAGKLHTGRSRNEQIIVDLRLWLRAQLDELRGILQQLLTTFAKRAEAEVDVLISGYTHLQPAQAVRWSHWLLYHATMLQKDLRKLGPVREEVDECPLGVGALSGNPFALDRALMARELGFAKCHPNSLACVADRDFIIDTVSWGATLMSHLGRLAQDLINYSTKEFGFVRVADAYSTGSSLMPQKKNPDSLELIRGKAGTVNGYNYAVRSIVQSLPTSYNKDLQETVKPLFDCVRDVKMSLQITTGVVSTLTINAKRMRAGLSPEMLATDVADYLVLKGVPFRETHHIAGAVVKAAEDQETSIDKLDLKSFQEIDRKFEADIHAVFDFENAVEKRSGLGGTARSRVLEQAKAILSSLEA